MAMRCAALLVLALSPLVAARPAVVEIGSRKQLFLDDTVIASSAHCARVWNQPTKYGGNPVLHGEKTWENWVAYPDGGPVVLYDEADRVFKMWYQSFADDPRTPEYDQRYIMCYATSRDGIVWEKPDLGEIEWGGSKHNNIVAIGNRGLIDTNVIEDRRDPDAARRYKVLYYDTAASGGPVGVSVGFSPDGIHWNLHPGNPVLVGTGDTHTLLGWDDSVGRYVAYLRPKSGARIGEGGARVRVIGRSTSADFLHWNLPEVVLAPDAADPPDTQFYAMPVFRYEGHYIGLIWVFHTLPLQKDAQLAFSRDGVRWRRPACRPVFLPLGANGTWEDGMVNATTPFVHDDEIWIYYGGFNVLHNLTTQQTLGTVTGGRRREAAIGLAKLRLDGFASLDAALDTAVVTTRSVRFEGARLVLNIEPSMKGRGAVDEETRFRVELADAAGKPFPGFSLAESANLAAGGLRAVASWSGREDVRALAGRPVRLRFEFRNAKFYSFRFE